MSTASPRPGRPRRIAAFAAISGLLGGALATGLLAVTGAVGGGATTTVVEAASGGASQLVANDATPSLNAAQLYAKTASGVVDITAKGTSQSQSISPFGDPGQQEENTATGTGFLVGSDGYILTAAHVVDEASSITVAFADGSKHTAQLTSKDDATDVAVLKIDPSGLTLHPLTLGSSAALHVGDGLAAIGDPFGYQRSISTGVVSGLDRTISAPNGFTVAHAIQTDASLNPGNSGGPILNGAGQVIGIADQIATGGTSASAGVGFAVPIDLAKSELSSLEAGKTVTHAYIGVSTSDGGEGSAGALVQAVKPGGPAANGGLRAGDAITAIDGTKVADSNGLISAVAAHQPGDHVSVTVRRGSDSHKLDVTLGSQPTTAQSSNPAG
ncbi:MAG TPA: trypsin-like peptidase domain-containing protein [Solirubrobacteraceae bacterium]|nr:trypsin-like peptidase domain-containing protein [Solirubrobacteraceae bacterium]